jgi:hypothetical protein
MKYSDMNLKIDNATVEISVFPDFNIKVLQYLPIEDKNDIIQIALQNSEENGVYNLLKMRMFFNLYIVYLYTDLEFTDEEKLDPSKIYNELVSNGIMDAIYSSLDREEIEELETILEKTLKMKIEYRQTLASVLTSFVENLPINAESAMDIINKFNPEDFQRVIEFATAANGGRPIK